MAPLLHFIFVIRQEDLDTRQDEFKYIQQMAQFFKVWIKKSFSKDFEVQADIMTTKPRGLFQRLDTHTLLDDHISRGKNTFHFYLSHFRPFWTDCTCEGYHAENFGMVWWQKLQKDAADPSLFLAEKNCTTVSHEIAHELLRQNKVKKFIEVVHDTWVKHFYGGLEFEQYDQNFCITDDQPHFLTINTSDFNA